CPHALPFALVRDGERLPWGTLARESPFRLGSARDGATEIELEEPPIRTRAGVRLEVNTDALAGCDRGPGSSPVP
ncbi:MAG: hypothetical protein AAGA56_27335, partial [Myxococcota bacterium]